jgi:hypothetical protein
MPRRGFVAAPWDRKNMKYPPQDRRLEGLAGRKIQRTTKGGSLA